MVERESRVCRLVENGWGGLAGAGAIDRFSRRQEGPNHCLNRRGRRWRAYPSNLAANWIRRLRRFIFTRSMTLLRKWTKIAHFLGELHPKCSTVLMPWIMKFDFSHLHIRLQKWHGYAIILQDRDVKSSRRPREPGQCLQRSGNHLRRDRAYDRP